MFGYGYYGMFWDPTYFLVLIGVIISMVASAKLKGTYARYSKVRCMSGNTGAQAAERILQQAGLNVRVERIAGNLTDHYDPRTKTLRLSESVYGSNSIAAVGVAAHECGHAIQDARAYVPLKLRAALVPVCNFGTQLSWPIIIIGIIMGYNQSLLSLGIIMFSAGVLFQLVTLPVEFNASNRAIRILADSGILYHEEVDGAKKVLSAAALTYVAAAAGMLLQLLRLILLFGGRNRD